MLGKIIGAARFIVLKGESAVSPKAVFDGCLIKLFSNCILLTLIIFKVSKACICLIARKHVSSGVVSISFLVYLLSVLCHCLHYACTVLSSKTVLGALSGKAMKCSADICHLSKSTFSYLQPALCIRNILLIILPYLSKIVTKL